MRAHTMNLTGALMGLACTVLFALGDTGASRARAQASVEWGGSAAPPGSYLQSCTGIVFTEGHKLTANCKGGEWHPVLDLSQCAPGADIVNKGGALTCAAPRGTWGFGGAVPAGSYRQTCSRENVRGQGEEMALTATCRGGDGHDYVTSVPLKDCRINADIGNHQGQLLCTPFVAPDKLLGALGCLHYMGRPSEYTCKTAVAYRSCRTVMSTPAAVQACNWEYHPNSYVRNN